MFVEKLELFGFKSFANRTEIPLSRGITAIVGPNGCGKSNISDAFRWVLGEQNARTLRGERIQDVIFKGTRTAKPLGMAEVRLTVGNDDGALPVEYTQVAVARRIFRSGDSEFQINRNKVRLKDIKDLFAGTGMGNQGYSIIERDMVDQVLSDKDEARRLLFEEAAGIVRYKQRRRESERRLEGVEQDLTRIEDMIQEIGRGVRSLSRQAGKVRRWRRFKDEADRHEIYLSWRRWKELLLQSSSSDQLRARREAERQDLSSRVSVLDAQREAQRLRLLELADRLDQAQKNLEQSGRRLTEVQEEIRILAAVRDAWQSERQDLETRLDRDGRRRVQLEEEMRPLIPAIESLSAELATAEESASEASHLREEADQALRAIRAELQEAQQTTLDLTTSRSGHRKDLESRTDRMAAAVKRREGVLAHLEGFATRRSQVEGAFRLAEADWSRGVAERARLENELLHTEAGLEESRSRRNELERRVSEVGRRREGIAGRLRLLEEQSERHAGFHAAVRRLLEQRDSHPGLVGVVGEEVRLRAGVEDTGRAVLGDRVQWVLVRDEESAVEMMGRLREEGLGGVTFFPLAEAGRDPSSPDDRDGGIRGLFDFEPSAGRFIGRLGSEFRLADDLRAARSLAMQTGLRVVTRDGDVAEGGGCLRLAGGDTEEAEILRREQEIPQLAEGLRGANIEIEGLDSELAGVLSREQSLEQQAVLLEESLSVLEERRGELGRLLSGQKTELAMLEEEQIRLGQEVEGLDSEVAFLDEEMARLRNEVDRSDHDSAEAQSMFEDLHRRAEEHERIREERNRAATDRSVEVARLRGELEAQRGRRQALQREFDELGRAVGEAELRMETRSDEVRRAADRGQELQSGVRDLEAERERGIEEAGGARREHQECQDALFRLDEELRENRRRLDSLVQDLHADDVERLQTRSKAERVRERIQEEFAVDLETWAPPEKEPGPRRSRRAGAASEPGVQADGEAECDAPAVSSDAAPAGDDAAVAPDAVEDSLDSDFDEDEDASDGEDLQECEDPAGDREGPLEWTDDLRRSRLVELNGLLARMGSLNYLAEEEYTSARERLEFHQKQSADLRQAREDLLEAIRRINETAGEMFAKTFESIRANFDQTYLELFPGGEAALSLLGGDPLEGDIEISARPRGKKLESIRLLSSGERALTAIALLFAIYLTAPSPVCLLDEVDAPLDDANLERFLSLVQRFSERTQFVVVTHNKKTMAVADRLYGVTMEEPGISRIVAVSLDDGSAERIGRSSDGDAAEDGAALQGEPA